MPASDNKLHRGFTFGEKDEKKLAKSQTHGVGVRKSFYKASKELDKD